MSERAHVLVLASGLGFGGAETVIRDLVTTIDPQRFQVTVGCVKVVGPVGQQLADAGYDVVCLTDPASARVNYFTFLELRRVVQSRRIRLVHTHTTDGLADAALCRLTMPWLKLVHTFHFGNYPHVGRNNLRMEKMFSRVANQLVAVGEIQRQQIRRVFGFSERRLGMVWNGVPPAAAVQPGAADAFRRQIGAADRLVIGTIATMIEQKGLRDLLAVAAQLRDLRDRVCFVVAGDGHLRSELEGLRRELNLDDMVCFPGWVANAAQAALPAFDVFFQPSLWEAMSIAVLEAMAAARPIVATTVGENGSVVEDGRTGLLVPSRDVGAMAHALRGLIDDAERRRQLGAAALARFASHFTVDHMVRRYEQLYLDTLGVPMSGSVAA